MIKINLLKSNDLKDFCDRQKISLNQLAKLTNDSAKRSTIHNLLNSQIKDRDYVLRLRRILAKNLPNFLIERGLPIATINQELQRIFTEKEFIPMTTERVILPGKAQKWYGLKEDPFGINLREVSDVYKNDDLQRIYDGVIDAIKFQGFASVTGDIGSGKTVLKAWVEETVNANSELEIIFIENFDMVKVSPSSIARAILEHFDYGKIPIDGVSKTRAVKRLLAERSDKKVAIAFDECHRLNDTTLSSLKNFLEMSSGGFRRYLGVIVFGQPKFLTLLAKSREISERLVRYEMPDFKKSAVEYLAHRLSLVGGSAEKLFDDDALFHIANNANTPLQLGNIANTAFLKCMADEYQQTQVKGSLMRSEMNLPNKERTENKTELKLAS